jgi:DNA-binding LytR/AlgR family response regulator
MKLNCIIVEDEPLSSNFIKKFCEKSDKVTVKKQFTNALDALAYLKENETELIFLDVEMPGINGFQMLDNLSYSPKVIMTTSKTDYAYTAFEYNVTDFLKKPVIYDRFLEAIDKVLESYKNNMISQEDNKNDILIKSNGSYIRLVHDDILYIEGMGDYVKYVTTEKTYIAHSTLRTAEETMTTGNFMKVHRSYIVNVNKIKNFTDNTLTIEGACIPVSKSNKADLLDKLRSA